MLYLYWGWGRKELGEVVAHVLYDMKKGVPSLYIIIVLAEILLLPPLFNNLHS